MGTFGIIRALFNHWKNQTNPIYRAESRRKSMMPAAQFAWRVVHRVWRPFAAIFGVVLAMTAADFFCSGSRILPLSLTNAFLTLFSVVGGGLVLVAVMVFAYLWPVAVAVNASGIVVQERQRQTWDLLLITPFDRADLLLAKLASSLRLFNPYGEILLWVQSFLAIILSVVIVSDFTLQSRSDWLVQVTLLCLALFEFGVGRVQDYALSSLLGAIASVLLATREAAWTIAMLLALMPVLLRAALTVFVIALMPAQSFAKLAVLFATGPASTVVLAAPPTVAVLALIVLLLVREGLIRLLFDWLVRRLGESPHHTAA
jgi:hypothetical protein